MRVHAVLAFACGLLVLATGCGGSRRGLFVVGPDGGKPRKVTSGCILEFRWSPDGNQIVVAHGDESEVLNPHGDRTTSLDHDSHAFTWSPNGSRIAYSDSQVRLWVTSSAVGAKPTLVFKGNRSRGSPDTPSWAPDGKQIAFEAGGIHGARVALIRPDGSGLVYLTGEIAAGPRLATIVSPLLNVSVATHYSISPDGEHVAYSVPEADHDDLSVVNADGLGKMHLGEGTLGDWSPDGRRIVFWQSGNAYTVRADGTGKRKIGSGASGSGGEPNDVASWSSQGQIAYVDNRGCFSGPS